MERHPIFGEGYSTLPIEKDDIDSVAQHGGWLTDTCIRRIIEDKGDHSISSGVNIADPTWLSDWEKTGCTRPNPTPAFLNSQSSATGAKQVQGLAMPYNLGNSHWTTIYVNYEARGAVYFDSLNDHADRAERLMFRFFDVFHHLFQGEGPFRWEVSTRCAKQRDYSSCGIYTVRNCLDLLDRKEPSREPLSKEEVSNFRINGAEILRRMKKVEDLAQDRRHVMFDLFPSVRNL